MGLADNAKARGQISLTNTQKNEQAAITIRRALGRSVRIQRQILKNIKGIVAAAPGNKAAILDLLGADKDEAVSMINNMRAFVNTHKMSGDEDINV